MSQPRGENIPIFGIFTPKVVQHDTGREDVGHITGRDHKPPEDKPGGPSVWGV